ncbi:MAG: PH domain-containing protein [Candidatus Nanopelagicales bacterium]
MAYPQKLLSDGETVQFELRPHFRALLVPILILLAIVFVGSWLFFLTGNSFLRWAILVIALVLFFPFVLVAFLRWLTTQYVFTNRRIITRRGIITKQGRDMPLSKVNNVSFDISVMGRILNYGALKIDSANTEGDLVIVDVPDVERIQREVYRLHEEDDERRRRRSDELGGDPVPPTDGT